MHRPTFALSLRADRRDRRPSRAPVGREREMADLDPEGTALRDAPQCRTRFPLEQSARRALVVRPDHQAMGAGAGAERQGGGMGRGGGEGGHGGGWTGDGRREHRRRDAEPGRHRNARAHHQPSTRN